MFCCKQPQPYGSPLIFFFFLIASNWSTCFKFLKHCQFPWVYWANIDFKKKSSQYDSPILDPSFPHVYLIESCPCQVYSDELLSDQGLLLLPLVHSTYSWQLHSSQSTCLCSERQTLAQYLIVVQSLYVLQIHAKMDNIPPSTASWEVRPTGELYFPGVQAVLKVSLSQSFRGEANILVHVSTLQQHKYGVQPNMQKLADTYT